MGDINVNIEGTSGGTYGFFLQQVTGKLAKRIVDDNWR